MTALAAFKQLCAAVHTPKMGAISQVQLQECERMFMAGYSACMARIMEATSLTDNEAEKVLRSITDEITDYHRLLGKIPGTHGAERS